MCIKNWKKEILSIPNLLSIFRLALIPVYVIIYLNGHYFLSASILAVSCITDLIDGKIARHFDMITTLGKLLDPIADKATQFTLILCLSLRYPILWNLVFLFVLKEGFQLIVGGITLKKGKMLDGALMAGKICTTVLFISLIILVLFPLLNHGTIFLITVIDAVFMVISFISYFLAYFGKNKKVRDLPNP